MKLDPSTLVFLKNFALINNSIVIEPGNSLSTKTPHSNIIAIAKTDQEFTDQIAIYDVSQFLNILSMFDKPEIKFQKNSRHAEIISGKSRVKYVFAEPSLIEKGPKQVKEIPSIAHFELTQTNISQLFKASSVMGLTSLIFEGKDGVISVGASADGSSSNDYKVEVGETDSDWKAHIKVEHIVGRLLPGTYNIDVNERLIKFGSTERNLNYWIARESKNEQYK